MNLSVSLCGVTLKNPVIAASGCYGFGAEYQKLYDVGILGGISYKGLTRERREGNPPPRIVETASGILNAVGLQNPGLDAFLQDIVPTFAGQDTCHIVNVAGACTDDYVQTVQAVSAQPLVDFIELNVSCPNVHAGGAVFGANPRSVEEITAAVRPVCTKPLMIKLSPAVEDIAAVAQAAQRAGADCISLINTIPGMAIDAKTRRPVLGNVTGGLSGPAIKPAALRMVYLAAQAVSIPVVGMGGIMTGEDVAEFLLAGATAVMVGTAHLCDPMAGPRIVEELRTFCQQNQIEDLRELIGGLKV